MRLPKLAIENHQFTNIAYFMLVLTGLISFITMPRSEDPQVSPPGSTVVVIYPGATPTDMEELVIDPLEEAINELEDIKTLESTSEDGIGIIQVEFLTGSDPDDKYSDVVQKVNSVRQKLPDDIYSLETTQWSISDVQIMQLALTSETAPYKNLEKEAERLKKLLEKVNGVKKVKLWAFPEQQVNVALDMEKMAHYKISISQVMNAIGAANQNIPGGYIDISTLRFNVQTTGSYGSLQEIKNTIVHSRNGKIVFLKDIANVELAYKDNNYFVRYKDKKAVLITLTQKEDTNIFNVTDGVKEQIKEFKKSLPASHKLYTSFDQSESVHHRLTNFFSNLLQGLVLVGIVIFLSVNIRASIIVMLAIPFSILIGIGFVDLSGIGLQQMTISGLVIALGLLVDNAIVVIENITRFMKQGYTRKEAAIQATSQIGWAVVSATATTVLAFVPMMMMQDVTGDFIRSMPLTVVFTLLASLLISLTLTPYLSSKFLKVDAKESRFRKMLDRIVSVQYKYILNKAISHPGKTILLTLLLFFSSFALLPLVGVSYFPKAEKPQFFINIDTPNGTNLAETAKVAQYVETILQKEPDIKKYTLNIGHGNPRVYYNVISKRERSTHAQFFIELLNYDADRFHKLITRLRNTFNNYAGAKIEVKELEQGPPINAPIEIRILGDNLDSLKTISKDVENIIASMPGTININNPLGTSKLDIRVNVNKDKAGLYGVPLVEIDRTVRAAIAGLSVTKYRDAEGKEYDITLRLPVENSPKISDLEKIYITSVTGTQIPLQQLASIELESSPQIISHYGLDRNVSLTADVVSGVSANKTTLAIIEKLKEYKWPAGYRYAIGGELESTGESFGGLAQAFIIAIIGILAVLVLQFKSYSQPLIVFAAIPFATIGSIFALLVTGNTFSFTAFVGFTSLAGIVINNSIILVDYTNQLRREGIAVLEALEQACQARFVPIILTTATTIGGLLPLTLGGGTLWAPMGWTLIGGLTTSTFLTLILVPVLYKIFSKKEQ